jgi:hypothetical protein
MNYYERIVRGASKIVQDKLAGSIGWTFPGNEI